MSRMLILATLLVGTVVAMAATIYLVEQWFEGYPTGLRVLGAYGIACIFSFLFLVRQSWRD